MKRRPRRPLCETWNEGKDAAIDELSALLRTRPRRLTITLRERAALAYLLDWIEGE